MVCTCFDNQCSIVMWPLSAVEGEEMAVCLVAGLVFPMTVDVLGKSHSKWGIIKKIPCTTFPSLCSVVSYITLHD